MRSRRISSVIHDLPSWIRPVGGVRLGILITSGMPSSLAWLTAPLFVFIRVGFVARNHALPPPSVSLSSRRSASAATLAASSISAISTTFSASAAAVASSTAVFLRRSAASAWMAPPRSLSGRAEDRVDAQSKQSSHRRHPWRCPFPFCLWIHLN
ncbi:unnamed protein product [Microthlaspi erraticum]|uniref:Uncharacterized protein n=1 Tax=Microthlaspi erraticum TaxID=1685480 RepID=A0A6D2J8G5_9BRAS|nr:unnamed protein product [Microthlaspi erraticum]